MALGMKKLDAICAKLKTRDVPGPSQCITNDQQENDDQGDNGQHVSEESNNHLGNAQEEDHESSHQGNKPAPACDMAVTDTPTKHQFREPNQDASISRKKRRKNQNPRNIAQVRDYCDELSGKDEELTEYEINNRDIDFQPMTTLDGEKNECDISVTSEEDSLDYGHSGGFQINHTSNGSKDSDSQPSISEAIDLSVNNRKKSNDYANSDVLSNNSRDMAPIATSNYANETSVSPSIPSKPDQLSNSADAAALKNYATSTMNELLSIYGLGEETDAIIKSVPLQNFTSGKILERHAPSDPRRLFLGSASKHDIKTSSFSPQVPSSSINSPISISSPNTSSIHNVFSSSSSPSVKQQVKEGVYQRFMDNMVKLAQGSKGEEIG